MKLLIISDTHGDYPQAVKAVEAAGPVDLIVHLGDGREDVRTISEIIDTPILMVPGNCDPGTEAERELVVTLADKKFLISHGDRYGVKSGIARLQKRATDLAAAVVLYGHTHYAAIDTLGGILFINPGALNAKSPQPSYAVLTIDNGRIAAKITIL